jgi:hypothetical protein
MEVAVMVDSRSPNDGRSINNWSNVKSDISNLIRRISVGFEKNNNYAMKLEILKFLVEKRMMFEFARDDVIIGLTENIDMRLCEYYLSSLCHHMNKDIQEKFKRHAYCNIICKYLDLNENDQKRMKSLFTSRPMLDTIYDHILHVFSLIFYVNRKTDDLKSKELIDVCNQLEAYTKQGIENNKKRPNESTETDESKKMKI